MTPTKPTTPRMGRPAFTIIEMLVVLFIIGILTGIVITLAQRVTQGGKYSATRNVLEIAEGLVTEYVTTREGPPPSMVYTRQTQANTIGTDDTLSPDMYVFPIVDGRFAPRTLPPGVGNGSPKYDKDLDPEQPSAALLMLAMAAESSVVDREFKAIDARFVKIRDVYAHGWLVDANGDVSGQPVRRRLRLPVLVDAFGNMVRYVHPAFQGGYGAFYNNADPSVQTARNFLKAGITRPGGQLVIANFERSYRPFPSTVPASNPVGDGDEGLAVGGHGYFYSPGMDADPGTREDNVYLKQPTFPSETARFN